MWDDTPFNFCSNNLINLCSHHLDQQNMTLMIKALPLVILSFFALFCFPVCSGVCLFVYNCMCMRRRERKAEGLNSQTSNNKRSFKKKKKPTLVYSSWTSRSFGGILEKVHNYCEGVPHHTMIGFWVGKDPRGSSSPTSDSTQSNLRVKPYLSNIQTLLECQ